MIKILFKFFKPLVKSRGGWLLLIIHLIIMAYRFLPGVLINSEMPCNLKFRSPGWIYMAGDYFHFDGENMLMQILLFLDLPAISIAELINLPASAYLCDYTKSWTLAVLALFFASLQWMMIGYGMQQLFKSSNRPT